MKTTQLITVAYRKLRSFRTKTLLAILPIALLLAGGTVLTAEAQNVQKAINDHVLGALQEQSKYITVAQVQQTGNLLGSTQQPYNGGDVQKVKAIHGVSKAALGTQVPVGALTTTDLVPDHTLTINSLTALDSSLAKQYADIANTYDGEGAIPIVLSASQFQEMTENWNGKTDIDVSMQPPSSGGPANVDLNKSGGPIGTRAINYNRQQLIGKEFTVSAGTLPALQDYAAQPGASFGQLTFHKYSAAEMEQKEADRRAALSPYWDYDSLSAPKTYTFRVVGITNDQQSQTAYIPSQAAQKLMQDEIKKQLDARTSAAIPASTLSGTLTGLTFNGTTLAPNAASTGNAMIGGSSAASYVIPGLVAQTDNSGRANDVVTDASIYEKSIPTSTRMFLEIADIYDRPHVVSALNGAGYAYQDTGKLNGLLSLKERLANSVGIFIWLFGAVVVAALIIAFMRFIAESKREIGIFRALGATKADIAKLFVWQAAMVGAAAYAIGMLLGAGSTLLLAAPMSSWFNGVVRSSINGQLVQHALTHAGAFATLSIEGVVILSALLWLATVLTAAVVSAQAARINPAEAIKTD
jgi:hypothetical protein